MKRHTVNNPKRRELIKTGAKIIAAAPALVYTSGLGHATAAGVPFIDLKSNSAHRSLSVYNTHTQEHLSHRYFKNGQYDSRVLSSFDYILRDHHANAVHRISPQLIDLLYAVQNHFGNRDIHVVSCYRTEETNRLLRRSTTGVARNSYHTRGMAIDLRIPGISTRRIRDFAKRQRVGGIGWYPQSGFVHLDTGPIRYW